MKNRVLLIGLLALGACATTRKYQQMLEGWVGRPSTELVASWGPPTTMFTEADGSKLYEYRKIDEETRAKSGRTVAGYEPSCRTFFQVGKDGRITGWKWEGANCRTK